MADSITPFPGHPAANLTAAEFPVGAYGMQPGATPLIKELAATLADTLHNCRPHGYSAAAKAALRGYLCESKLLDVTHKQAAARSYRRHLLYVCPQGTFSILAIVWNPGQSTPIHGHTAWGAAGVVAGNLYCDSFQTRSGAGQLLELQPRMTLRLKPGDIASVEPGFDAAHRIGNDMPTKAISLHVYGRDLLQHPASVNINLCASLVTPA